MTGRARKLRPRRSSGAVPPRLPRSAPGLPLHAPDQTQKFPDTSEAREFVLRLFPRPANLRPDIQVAYMPSEGAAESGNELRCRCFACSGHPELAPGFPPG